MQTTALRAAPRRRGNGPQLAALIHAVAGLVSKGVALSELNRDKEAIPILEDLFDRFDADESPAIDDVLMTVLDQLMQIAMFHR